MVATQHALWMIGLAILSAIFCWFFWKGRPSVRRVAWSLVALVAPLLFPPHACGRGKPITQGLLGGACMAAVLICAKHSRARLALVIVLALATIGLMIHHDSLVHREDLIGFPGENRFMNRGREERIESLKRDMLDLAAKSNDRIAAGWISEQRTPMDRLDVRARESLRHQREFGDPLWHSAFTRLYWVRKVPGEVWSPGGSLSEAAERLEWRDR